MKKLLLALLSLALFFPALAATSVSAQDSDPIRVAVVYSGNLGDQSYNDSANIGATQAIEDFGIEVRNMEGTTPDVWESNLLSAADQGYDLVICSSSNFEEYLKDIAPMYPDVKFAIIDTVVEGDNIQSISFAQNEGSFLAGAAAALFTEETDIEGVNEETIIGWVGGMDIPVLNDFFIGYEQGAKYINPDITVLQSFAGTWNDPLRGKELTLAQFEQGADIVMNVASGTGPGILEAAAEAGKYAIGVDLNQDNDQPGSVLTSMIKRVDTAVYTVISDVVNGTFEGNKTAYLDVEAEGVGLTDFTVMKEHLGDQFPEHIIERIEELAAMIASGEIVVDNAPGYGRSDEAEETDTAEEAEETEADAEDVEEAEETEADSE